MGSMGNEGCPAPEAKLIPGPAEILHQGGSDFCGRNWDSYADGLLPRSVGWIRIELYIDVGREPDYGVVNFQIAMENTGQNDLDIQISRITPISSCHCV